MNPPILLHKHNPDGTLASSWHPWYDGDEAQLPIQEDETALVIWALWHHFVQYRDIEFVKPLSVSPLTWSQAAFVNTMRLCRRRMATKEEEVPSDKMKDWIGKLFAETCDVMHGACQVE